MDRRLSNWFRYFAVYRCQAVCELIGCKPANGPRSLAHEDGSRGKQSLEGSNIFPLQSIKERRHLIHDLGARLRIGRPRK